MSEKRDGFAVYEALVVCVNCGYRGSARIPLGKVVSYGVCPVCATKAQLRPDHEAHEEEWAHEH